MSDQRPVTWPQELEETLRRDLPAFDWDGQIGPVTAEVVPLVAPHYRRICEVFWEHYLVHPAVAAIRDYYTPERLEKAIQASVVYMRAKFENPLGHAWMAMACANARDSDRAGMPLAAQLASLTASYRETLNVVAAGCPGDTERLARYIDVMQRVCAVEAHLLTSYISQLTEHRSRKARQARSDEFRESIAGSIDAAAELGTRIRAQAGRTSQSAKGMIGKTSEVAAAAEQSAVAMREAAQTAAGLIRAIEDARTEVDAAAEIANRATSQAG